VTQGGTFKFKWGPFTQITSFGFDPDCNGHILVGTQQAGIFQTFDKGSTWAKVADSELIPSVSSFFFPGNEEVIISSYGRGLWKLSYNCPVARPYRPRVIELAEPVIYWKGARVPISQIHDPDVCPVCGYFLAIGGRILDYTVNAETGQVTEVFLSDGEIKGYSWNGAEMKVPFKVSIGLQQGAFGGDKQIAELLTGENQIKGLFLEGDILKGLIVYSRDLSKEQLPKKTPLGPHIRVDLNLTGAAAAGNANPITVTGTGFNPRYPVEVLLDGKIVQQERPVKFDGKGNFTISIPPSLGIGGHTVLIRQKTDKGIIQDASTFIITVRDK
jgi:hypothetical protein